MIRIDYNTSVTIIYIIIIVNVLIKEIIFMGIEKTAFLVC